jgi:hypothetical protein
MMNDRDTRSKSGSRLVNTSKKNSKSTFLMLLITSAISYMMGSFQAFHAGVHHCEQAKPLDQGADGMSPASKSSSSI